MISVQDRGRLHRERPSVAPSVAPFDSFLPPESEISEYFDGTPGPKSSATTSVPKYSEDDLQKIFKAALEARAFAPAFAASEIPREKLKTLSPDVYCGKSHMDYYNFCQQCENHFATAGATGPTRIPFAASFLRDRISFRWQQYKRKRDGNSSVLVTWDEFKAFLCSSLGDSQAFVDTYWGKFKRDF